LLPDKAIWWKERKLLFISDVHFGKVDHFRKNGLPIPSSAGVDNYVRLSRLIERHQPNSILFLGDLFHSSSNMDWEVCKTFFAGYPNITLELVIGNHDLIPVYELKQVFDQVHETPIQLGPYLLSHEPESPSDLYNICGHIHPAHRLKVKGRPSLRLPCFYFDDNRCILPAFGSFTGMHTLSRQKGDHVYVVADGEVIPCQ